MGLGWARDKAWADKYWPQIEQIIRRVAGEIVEVSATDQEEDQAGRDYRVDCGGIAARIRRPHVTDRDVTIRSWRVGGVTTELQKWLNGGADWLVYGWTDEEGIPEWVVVSISRLLDRGLHEGRQPIHNRDGKSSFIAIPVYEIVRGGLLLDGELRYPTTVHRRGSVHPVVRCPRCSNVAYTAGPEGLPQRRYWRSNWIWVPGQ